MKRVGTSGFTIVELLIVVVVIAVLATITIVSYNGITNSTNDSAVQSDLRTISKQFEVLKHKNGVETYPYSDTASTLRTQLAEYSIAPAKTAYTGGTVGNFLYVSNKAGKEFALIAKSKSGKSYFYSSKTGAVEVYTLSSFPEAGADRVRERTLGPTAVDIVDAGTWAWGYGATGWSNEWIK